VGQDLPGEHVDPPLVDPAVGDVGFEGGHVERLHQGVDQPAELGVLRGADDLAAGTLGPRYRGVRDGTVQIERVRLVEFELRAALRGLYEFILKRIDPVVVILVTGWSKPTLIETCRILDIPVVELQHGTINPYNVEYSHPGERSKTLFADYLFTWGEFWNEQTEFPISDNRVYSVGYPYFERERTQYIDVESSNQLLVVSQPIYGDVIAQVATDLSAADPSYDIVYKLHPAEYDGWKDRNPELERSEITVIDSDDPPLYQLFAESRAQLGVASTALFEGLGFGLETYLLEQPGVEYMNGLLERNVGTLVHDHTDLPSTLDTTGDLPKSVVEDIFRPDPIDRIDAALDDITDGQV